MPVTLGAKQEHGFDQPLGLLSDCHRRIERFLDAMISVLERAGERSLVAEERDALEVALRYFETAAPRHTQDEDESLFPRLRACALASARAAMTRIDALQADHRRAESLHAEVADLCRLWLDTGPLARPQRQQLARLLGDLREIYVRHIAVEDHDIFPLAGQVLNERELAQIGLEMAQRRGVVHVVELGRPEAGVSSMSHDSERLRRHPTERFHPSQHLIDLREAAAQLLAEPQSNERAQRQKTLYRHGPVTVALFVFDRGAQLPQHVAEGVVTVQVLEGRLKMSAEGQAHDLSAGQMLVLAPGVKHDVRAEEPTRMLLTVCLETSASAR
jgi:quercetin dioxygenase-like cupin family protein/hemerythrin-like domain-containing protein